MQILIWSILMPMKCLKSSGSYFIPQNAVVLGAEGYAVLGSMVKYKSVEVISLLLVVDASQFKKAFSPSQLMDRLSGEVA